MEGLGATEDTATREQFLASCSVAPVSAPSARTSLSFPFHLNSLTTPAKDLSRAPKDRVASTGLIHAKGLRITHAIGLPTRLREDFVPW